MVCGRRWGKTRLGAWKALRTAIEGGRVWWVAPVYQTAEIAWRILEPLIAKIPGTTSNQTDHVFFFPGGGELWFKSAELPKNLRGEGLNGLIMDEADFIEGSLWSKVLRPALADRKGWALFISTPNTKGGWFHSLYRLGQSGKNPQWGAWHHPSWTNPFLDPKEIEDAKDDMSQLEFDQEFGAEFVQSPDTVYHNFDEFVNVAPCPFNPALHLYMGLDFNNYPRVACFIQRQGEVFRVVGEVYHPTQLTTDQHAALCAKWVQDKGLKLDPTTKRFRGVTGIPDSSGKNLRHDGGTDVNDFIKAGFTMDYPEANPGIQDRDNQVLARIKNVNGDVRLLIDTLCINTLQSFREFKNKNRGKSPWGHMLDALGYVIHRLVSQDKAIQIPLTASKPAAQLPHARGRALPRGI